MSASTWRSSVRAPIAAARRIGRELSSATNASIVLYAQGATLREIAAAFDEGVRGAIARAAPLDELVRALHHISSGATYRDPRLTEPRRRFDGGGTAAEPARARGALVRRRWRDHERGRGAPRRLGGDGPHAPAPRRPPSSAPAPAPRPSPWPTPAASSPRRSRLTSAARRAKSTDEPQRRATSSPIEIYRSPADADAVRSPFARWTVTGRSRSARIHADDLAAAAPEKRAHLPGRQGGEQRTLPRARRNVLTPRPPGPGNNAPCPARAEPVLTSPAARAGKQRTCPARGGAASGADGLRGSGTSAGARSGSKRKSSALTRRARSRNENVKPARSSSSCRCDRGSSCGTAGEPTPSCGSCARPPRRTGPAPPSGLDGSAHRGGPVSAITRRTCSICPSIITTTDVWPSAVFGTSSMKNSGSRRQRCRGTPASCRPRSPRASDRRGRAPSSRSDCP